MDLFLMDLILKGHVPQKAHVLDIGCGEGRNGIYFLQQGFEYQGWDTDESKLRLIEYMAQSMKQSNAKFKIQDLRDAQEVDQFDFIICARVLHFAESRQDFFNMWNILNGLLMKGGILYLTMDSIIDAQIGKPMEDEKVEFPGGKIRFPLSEEIYSEIKKGFEEIEPLRTLVHHKERAQSFVCLRKI